MTPNVKSARNCYSGVPLVAGNQVLRQYGVRADAPGRARGMFMSFSPGQDHGPRPSASAGTPRAVRERVAARAVADRRLVPALARAPPSSRRGST
jgi:hypothetical protein